MNHNACQNGDIAKRVSLSFCAMQAPTPRDGDLMATDEEEEGSTKNVHRSESKQMETDSK
jgi:hypothetical protein